MYDTEEIHIFDFDGTLFSSPAPSEDYLNMLYAHGGRSLHGKLVNPRCSGGYGWFQDLASLSPPFVPEKPEIGSWYVMPILNQLASLYADTCDTRNNNNNNNGDNAPDADNQQGRKLLYVLTGRDEKYRQRIEALLEHAGVRDGLEAVILKPGETDGTVKYKLSAFFRIIREKRPRRVYYYEDRMEQGGRLLMGMRVLHDALYGNGTTSSMVDVKYFPCADLDGSQPPAVITTEDLFSGDGIRARGKHAGDDTAAREETRALNAGRRWAAATFTELNNSNNDNSSGGNHTGNNSEASIPSPLFEVPPEFSFTMLMVPPKWADRSEYMLDARSLQQLVNTLKRATEALGNGNEGPNAYGSGRGGRGGNGYRGGRGCGGYRGGGGGGNGQGRRY